VVVHETVSVAEPVVAFVDPVEGPEEEFPVFVVLEDGLTSVATGGYMVHCTVILYPKRPGHTEMITSQILYCNKQDLTPIGLACHFCYKNRSFISLYRIQELASSNHRYPQRT